MATVEAGVLDVYTTAIGMKKNRPGVMLSVLCHAADVERIENILFRETTTLGVRRRKISRRTLRRRAHSVETPWGAVAGKIAWLPDGAVRFSPEYESCREISGVQDIPLSNVYHAAQAAFDPAAVDEKN